MIDKEMTREMTFSEELPYFKERIEEVFDNYNNQNGNEDPSYICVLRDSKRIVRKAEKEITYQQADIRMLRKKVNLVSTQFQELQERADKIKVESYKEFAEKLESEINLTTSLSIEQDENVIRMLHNLLKEMIDE